MRPPSVEVSGCGLAARRRWRFGDRGFYRRELSLFAGAYVVYNAARWLFTGDLSQAHWHAASIMRFERELGLAVEASVQHRLDTGLWSPFFSYVYMAAQLVVLPGSLVWLYRRAPGVYRALRNTVLGTWLIAIPIYAIFPVAPPRLAHAGIVDAVSEQAGFALTGRSTLFFNPLAAVPSLHVGFAFAIGIAAAVALRAPAAKALALLWGPLVSLAVVVTGNHYLFDIAAGLVVTAGRRRDRKCGKKPRAMRSGRLIHQADSRPKTPVSTGYWKASPALAQRPVAVNISEASAAMGV